MRRNGPQKRYQLRLSLEHKRYHYRCTLEPNGHNCESCKCKDAANAAARLTKVLSAFRILSTIASNCKGTLELKHRNRNNCPRMEGCSECGSMAHKSVTSFACPEHKCTNCQGSSSRRAQRKQLLGLLPLNANYDLRRMRRNGWSQRVQLKLACMGAARTAGVPSR